MRVLQCKFIGRGGEEGGGAGNFGPFLKVKKYNKVPIWVELFQPTVMREIKNLPGSNLLTALVHFYVILCTYYLTLLRYVRSTSFFARDDGFPRADRRRR